ncbi:hypothetical protein [Nocardia terpenica]|uniref:Peptide chain release factor 1 n=1 Tax=Nocardia terpenica TaxID=455432 RepID=A0A164MA90_9NOCA|nr:hypothetical protein [Nocardia terpenica]KZM73184.1 hypothetical protein AWN90_31330 [Nocardia terpenica]NQE91830.1 hypothetical protein [Nocardia terpenica]
MVTSSLRELADHEGPFASVYIDSAATGDAAPRHRLQRRAVHGILTEKGAPPPLVAAVDGALAGLAPGPVGCAVIAARDGVLLTEALPTPPRRQILRLSALPYLIPLLGLRQPRTPYVIVLIDRDGADLVAVNGRGERIGDRPWRELRRHTGESVSHSIAAVAAEATRLADRAGATLVLVGGAVAERGALTDALAPRGRRIVALETVTRASDSDRRTIDVDVRRILREEAELRRRAVVDCFAQELRRSPALAVQGLAATTAALRAADADVLLVDPERLTDQKVRVGADPTQVAPQDIALGHTWLRRADEALPLAALASRADVVPTDRRCLPADGVGALLRHG